MVLAFNFTPTQKPIEYFEKASLSFRCCPHRSVGISPALQTSPLICFFYFILQPLHLHMTFGMITTIKSPRGKMPLSVIAIIICSLAFMVLLYTERLSFLASSSTIFRFKPCAAKHKVSTAGICI